MLIQNNLYNRIETTAWIVIEESPEYKFYDNIRDLSVRSFWYHSNDTKRNPWVMCVHIAQLMTHPAMYTIPFTLQLCYKPLGILQRVTKSQKVHISSHDGLKKLHNIKFAWHRPQNLPEKEHSSRNFSCPNQIFWTKNTPLWLTKRIFSNVQKEQIVNKFKKLDNVHSNVATFASIYHRLSHRDKNPVLILLLIFFS